MSMATVPRKGRLFVATAEGVNRAAGMILAALV